MKKYTIEDFKDFERMPEDMETAGLLFCPAGDYSEIKEFPEKCLFDSGSKFGSNSTFGDYCEFYQSCSFGDDNTFGQHCQFGFFNRFGARNHFGSSSHFYYDCVFGEGCTCENGHPFKMLYIWDFLENGTVMYVWRLENGENLVRWDVFLGEGDEFISFTETAFKKKPRLMKKYRGVYDRALEWFRNNGGDEYAGLV